jgi:Trk K+ transport system NAD-binding subunit
MGTLPGAATTHRPMRRRWPPPFGAPAAHASNVPVEDGGTVTEALADDPAILIVGDDVLAERVCVELAAAGGSRVRVVSPMNSERQEAFRRAGAAVTPHDADADESLLDAGVAHAVAILTLSGDDERNLSVALRARMLNPKIRVVLRQFGIKIGRKIEQNLPDSTVLSPAALSAATYAGAALDPGCFFGLRFPDAVDGAFVGFSRGLATELDVSDMTVAEAEEKLKIRIVALGERPEPVPDALIDPADTIVGFGPVIGRRAAPSRADGDEREPRPRAGRTLMARVIEGVARANPIARTAAVFAVGFCGLALLYFHFGLSLTWSGSAFDVTEAMTSTGFSDTTAVRHGAVLTAGAMLVMVGGTVFTSIFIGYVSAAITRAQWTAQQGLRRIRARGHYVICGGGRIGGAVVNLLTAAGKRVVVIEAHPDPTLIRRARESSIDMLTGDATNEDVLALCDVPHAAAVVVLTNSDPGNLEIALGARAIRADVPLVVRMENRTFARATADLFGIATFSPAALSAPAFAGLARYPGTLGRVNYAAVEHTIVQRWGGAGSDAPSAHAVPLAVWRAGEGVLLVHRRDEIQPGDTVIYALPHVEAGNVSA